MKITTGITALLLGISLVTQAQYNLDNLKMDATEATVEANSFSKLRIYPILANEVFREAHRTVGDYTGLKEAIEKKEIKVSEISEGGTVNTLYAENMSNDTIYIMAGEVVTGGKQDRVIAQDVIIAPNDSVNLAAFCVERGRWSHKSTGSNFEGYFNVSSKEVRKAAVMDNDQSKVWEKVGETTAGNSAGSSTSTYSALENSEEYQKELKSYLDKFKSSFDKNAQVVGVVAVTGDEVIGCDIFATHDLFVNAFNNLLHSYITEAVTNGNSVSIKHDKVQKYLDQFLADESKQEENLKGKGKMFKSGKRKIHCSSF